MFDITRCSDTRGYIVILHGIAWSMVRREGVCLIGLCGAWVESRCSSIVSTGSDLVVRSAEFSGDKGVLEGLEAPLEGSLVFRGCVSQPKPRPTCVGKSRPHGGSSTRPPPSYTLPMRSISTSNSGRAVPLSTPHGGFLLALKRDNTSAGSK